MKIEGFFKKQKGQPNIQGQKSNPDSRYSKKVAEISPPDYDTRLKSDRGNQSVAKRPRDAAMSAIDRDQRASAAYNASAPLSETTNRQLITQSTVAKVSEKQAVQVSAVDLCDSPSVSAAEPAQHGQHTAEAAVESLAADEQPRPDDMDIAAAPSAVTEHEAANRATFPQQAAAEPAPVVVLQSMSSDIPPDSSAANTSTTKIPQEVSFTHDQRKQLLEDCLKEVPLLEGELDKRPDLTCGGHLISSSSKKGSQQDLKQQVSLLVEGQSLPLLQLAQHISSSLTRSAGSTAAETQGIVEAGTSHSQAAVSEDADAVPAGVAAGSESVSPLVVRNIIQDVASRRSYGVQDGALAPVDAFEDVTAAYHWCWELRSLTGLPKAIKQQADAARRCRKQVLDRLKACSAYIHLAQSTTKSTKTAEAKLVKAAAKLSKLQSLQELQAVASAAAEAAQLIRQQSAIAAKERAAKEEQADKAAVCKAEKARQAEADRTAREAERAAREAEKAAKAAMKAAEAEEKAKLKAEEEKKREEARQNKAAEEAGKKEEKAKLKEVKKVAVQAAKKGFHSAQEMQKSQSLFMSFLKKEPRPATPPAGPSADNSQGASGSQQQQQQQETSGTGPVPPAGPKRVWAPPCCDPSEQQLALMQQLDQELPGEAGIAVQPLPELLSKLLQHWKALGKQHHRTWGLPPSWARKPGAAAAPEHIAATAAALYGEGVELFTLRCWRRKLIKHNDSVRPPYYGSWSRHSRSVGGRKPFGQDVELDYEVMSDQDWEEEPDGESLSDAAEDDDDPVGEEGEEDEEGFVVGDGYLSEDEGLKDEDGDAAMTPAEAIGAEEREKDPIEAAQERAKARGRHVIVVLNDLAPNMSWESTTNLDPTLLRASLKPTIFTPELTPLQPWDQLAVQVHGRPAAAGAPAATAALAGTVPADAGGNTPPAEAAVMAAAVAGSAGASGAGRKQSVFPEDMLGALVQHIQANSAQGLERLTDQFVESLHGACFSGKLTKKSVRDKIRDITTVKKGRVPSYAVKPEHLAVLGVTAAACSPRSGTVPNAVWGVSYKEDTAMTAPVAGDAAAGVGPVAEAMQVDDADVAQPKGAAVAAATPQDLQPDAEQTMAPTAAPSPKAAAAGTSPSCVAGVKRPASADPVVQVSDHGTAQEAVEAVPGACALRQEQAAQPMQAPAPAPPATKKQKTPGPGIARFFMKPKQQPAQQQQQLAAATTPDAQEEHQDGQQQQHQQTPPYTPRRPERDAAQVGDAPDAAAAAAAPVASAAAAAHGNHSGVLPMLTPPSADAADRPSLPNSPVPFRMNAAGEAGEAEADTGDAEQQMQQQRPPINRWHAQANCRGMSLQGGSTSSMPQQLEQQQEPSQPFNGFTQQQQQQQQHSLGFARASDLAVAGTGSPAAAATAAAAQPLKPRLQVPELPEGGSAPDNRFWKQLASWVACVKDPAQHDIDTALAVFSEQHLKHYIQSMPQSVLSAMVKTLGSYSQNLLMREACARCISNVALCLAVEQQPQDTASTTPQQAGQASPAGAPTASMSTSLKRKLGGSPSPGSSPRSAPVVVSFEELCAEPLLLTNLLLAAADPTNQLKKIQEVVGDEHTGSLLEALVLSRSALRATAALVGVGLPHPLSGNKEYCPAAAAAAGELRLRISSTPQWRGTFTSAVEAKLTSPDKQRSTYALMILYSLLSDPPAASQLVNKPRLARLLALRVLQRGAAAQDWVIRKWSLLVSSMLLSDDLFQSWILPQDGLSQFHKQQKEDEEIVHELGVLLASCINRPSAELSESGPDRIILGKCLMLTSLLVSVLGDQLRLTGNNGRLPSSIANLVGGGFGGARPDEGMLVTALKEVAMQDEWEEAAGRAREVLDGLQTAVAGEKVEMQEDVPG